MKKPNKASNKTDFQVKYFLKDKEYTFDSKITLKMITAYYYSVYGYDLKINKSIIDPEVGLTAEEFAKWVENGFGDGDVAEWNDELVLIGGEYAKDYRDNGLVQILGSIDKGIHNKELRLKTKLIPVKELQLTSVYHYKNFYDTLRDNGKQYFPRERRIGDLMKPNKYDIVYFYDDKTENVGVFKSFDKDSGGFSMLCYYDLKDETLHHTPKQYPHLFEFYTFEAASQSEIKILKDALAKEKLYWNPEYKRVEPIQFRAKRDETFWYIDSNMVVKSTLEAWNLTSKKRYEVGNYFRTEEDAKETLYKIKEILTLKIANTVLEETETNDK